MWARERDYQMPFFLYEIQFWFVLCFMIFKFLFDSGATKSIRIVELMRIATKKIEVHSLKFLKAKRSKFSSSLYDWTNHLRFTKIEYIYVTTIYVGRSARKKDVNL